MVVLGGNFNIANLPLFEQSMQGLRASLVCPDVFFCSDNIITWNKNISFLTDAPFMDAVNRNADTLVEKAILWRTYVLRYFARQAARLPGDFLEVGAYKGNTANIIADCVDLAAAGKTYWLYDAFEHETGAANHAMPEHGAGLHDRVVARFAAYPHVRVIKGYVPDSFAQGLPEKVAFVHVDLNQAPAEVAALEVILPRLVPGGVLVLDDYGWWGYRGQKEAEDPLLARHGLEALELPTGQGLVIRPL